MAEASYLTSTPSGVPWDNENSSSDGSPQNQISKMQKGTIVVVRKRTAVSQLLSLGYKPGFANLYVIMDMNGSIETMDSRIITLHLI
jgi:hypothetical protein